MNNCNKIALYINGRSWHINLYHSLWFIEHIQNDNFVILFKDWHVKTSRLYTLHVKCKFWNIREFLSVYKYSGIIISTSIHFDLFKVDYFIQREFDNCGVFTDSFWHFLRVRDKPCPTRSVYRFQIETFYDQALQAQSADKKDNDSFWK